MFVFAHVGITLGAATLIGASVTHFRPATKSQTGYNSGKPSSDKKPILEKIGLKPLSRFLDPRVLIIGSMVPDIIDKPLEFLGFGSGRSITHTLLVIMIILFSALYLYVKYKKTWLLAIAFGVLIHLMLDSMWAAPQTLFWPLHGWRFPATDLGLEQIGRWWQTFLTNRGVDIAEGIGLIILLGLSWIIVNQRSAKCFLLKGKI
jgi:membrane-bound metal-dependent hydrolase YbcI (DUF457 family)